MKSIACKLRSVVCFQFFRNATSAKSFLEYLNYRTGGVFFHLLQFHEIQVEVDTHEVWTDQKLLHSTGDQEIRDSALEASDS